MPNGSVHDADPASGRAEWRRGNWKLVDSFNVFNALRDGESVRASVAFEMHWLGDGERYEAASAADRFRVRGATTRCTIEWSGRTDTFRFRSDPADTSVSAFAAVVRERNGVFFE